VAVPSSKVIWLSMTFTVLPAAMTESVEQLLTLGSASGVQVASRAASTPATGWPRRSLTVTVTVLAESGVTTPSMCGTVVPARASTIPLACGVLGSR
jgi:hypothetical protein